MSGLVRFTGLTRQKYQQAQFQGEPSSAHARYLVHPPRTLHPHCKRLLHALCLALSLCIILTKLQSRFIN